MDGRFDLRLNSVFVTGTVYGPAGRTRVLLALDTGATRTLIRRSILRLAGYDSTRTAGRTRMTSATHVSVEPLILLDRLDAVGRSSVRASVVAHELPPTFRGHGLLGLDFFRGLVLAIDFARGLVSLRPPRRRWLFWR